MADENCKIIKRIATVEKENGWDLQLNLVSWYGRDPKYDIREWPDDGSKKGKGVTLTEEQVVALFSQASEILKTIKGEESDDTDTKEPVQDSEQDVEAEEVNELPF